MARLTLVGIGADHGQATLPPHFETTFSRSLPAPLAIDDFLISAPLRCAHACGSKEVVFFLRLTARLKPCPFKARHQNRGFPQPVNSCPHTRLHTLGLVLRH